MIFANQRFNICIRVFLRAVRFVDCSKMLGLPGFLHPISGLHAFLRPPESFGHQGPEVLGVEHSRKLVGVLVPESLSSSELIH